MLEQLKKAKGKGKTIQKSSGQEKEEEEEEEEKVGTRIRLGLKPWGELKKSVESKFFENCVGESGEAFSFLLKASPEIEKMFRRVWIFEKKFGRVKLFGKTVYESQEKLLLFY